jgi:ribosome modulation factor
MRFKLPKPLHGWRQFWGEVGIIVLGVLIALSAQQIVETLSQRSQIRQLRSALDKEIGYGLLSYQFRVSQDRCLYARLEELERWLEGWRAGKPQAMVGPIGGPRSGPARTSVWASRDPAVMAHMPLDAKLDYSAIYDEFANLEVQRLDERMTWLEIAQFDRARLLDNAAMMRLQGLIFRARWRAANITENTKYILEVAEMMGIAPDSTDLPPPDTAEFCAPVLPKP